MKSLLSLIVGLCFASTLCAESTLVSEFGGLRLVATKSYVILVPTGQADQRLAPTSYRRQIQVYVENIGAKPITIPTKPEHIGGSISRDLRLVSYGFFILERNQRQLIVSPYRYEPVTLEPGEITELPIYVDKTTVSDISQEKEVKDFVTFTVDENLAKRHGWWSGNLSAQASMPSSKE